MKLMESLRVLCVEAPGSAYIHAVVHLSNTTRCSFQLATPTRVTKADIIDRIATGTGLTKVETEAVVNGFFTTVMQALAEGDRIELRGFGSFRVQQRAPRTTLNPQTGEPIDVDMRYVPVFKPAKNFRKRVDVETKKRHPEG